SSLGQLHLSGGDVGSIVEQPVLTTHGWVVAQGMTIKAFDRYGVETLRATIGSATTGAPRVGPDGVIWVPTAAGMARILGDESVETLAGGGVNGPAAFTPSGQTVWSTASFLNFFSINRDGSRSLHRSLFGIGPSLTPPAVRRDGLVVVGASNGWIYAVAPY